MKKAIVAVVAALWAGALFAQADYPSKPVRMIVPHPAGGAADIVARLVAEGMSAQWKVPVIVENVRGVGGNLGAEQVYRAEPDGYTLLAGTPGPIAINGSLFKSLRYDQTRWVPVSILSLQPTVLAVRADLPAKSVRELIDQAKASPGKFNFASQGNGTTSHLTAKLFESIAGIQLVHVPYQGTGPAMNDLMGSRVDMLFDNPVGTLSPYRAGKIRILAIATDQRQPTLPEVPTFAEAGVAGFTGGAWIAIVAPPGTPRAVADKASAAARESVRRAEVREKLAGLGAEAIGATPAESAKFIAAERAKWRKVIEEANVVVQ
ncbi:MAG TPA: tripartite tricarboxylate transporter substrate binding protein [Burkholderiales bacterium]